MKFKNLTLFVIIFVLFILEIKCKTTVQEVNYPGYLPNNYYADFIDYCSVREYTLLVKDDYNLANMTFWYNNTKLNVTIIDPNNTEYLVTIKFKNVTIGSGFFNFSIINSLDETTIFDNLIEYECEPMPDPIDFQYINNIDYVVMSRHNVLGSSILFNMTNWNPKYFHSKSILTANVACYPSTLSCSTYAGFRGNPTNIFSLMVQLIPPYNYVSNNFTMVVKSPLYNTTSNITFLVSEIVTENQSAEFVNFQCFPNATTISVKPYYCFIDAINSTSLVYLNSPSQSGGIYRAQYVYGNKDNKTISGFFRFPDDVGSTQSTYFISVQPNDTKTVSPVSTTTYSRAASLAYKYPSISISQPATFPYSKFNDSSSPILNSIEFIPFGEMCEIVRVSIKDVGSGFSNSYDRLYMYASDIVSGTVNDGVFEIFINYSIKNDFYMPQTTAQIYFFDFYNRNAAYYLTYQYYNTALQNRRIPLPLLKDKLFFGLTNFTAFFYEKNNVNTSSGEVIWNTLYFNLTYPDPNIVAFYSPFKSYGETQKIRNRALSRWDNEKKLYSLDFPMNGRMFTGPSNTFQFLICNTGFYQTELANMFPETGNLQVYSDYADEMPPMVTEWSTLDGQRTVTINANETVTLGFNLTIEDRVNGFDYGSIIISSKKNPGVKFEFTLNDSLPGSTKEKSYYQFKFQVNGKCQNDEYRIYSLNLTDQGDWSSYISHIADSDYAMNPLMRFLDSDYPIITIQCDSTDTISPKLVNLSIFPNVLDIGGLDRTVTINITVSDENSGINIERPPLISLFSMNSAQIQSFIMEFVSQDNASGNVTFQISKEIPYGFGYPYGIFIKIEGIFDQSFNFLSVNSDMIRDTFNQPNNISIEFSATPLITSHSSVSSLGGIVTLYGRSLSGLMANTSIVNIKYATKSVYEPVRIVKIRYNVAMIIEVEAAIQPFKIQIINNNVFKSNEYIITPYLVPNPIDPTTSGSTSGNLCDTDKTCSGNGDCTVTGCICNDPWIGLYCNSRIVIIPTDPSPNTNEPSFNNQINGTDPNGNEINIATLISIVSVRELDVLNNNKVVFEYEFTEWIYTNISVPGSTQYLYETNITKNNQNTTISVIVEWFKEPTIVIFANQELKMNPSTMKYKITIAKFPFFKSLNNLQVVMQSSIVSNSNLEDSCTTKQFGSTSDNNYEYTKLQIDNYSLYGKFLTLAVLDGRINKITNQLLDSSSGSIQPVDTPTGTETYIGITLPNYKDYAILDPDFSVLIDSSPAGSDPNDNSICGSKTSKSKLSKTQLAGIIVGSTLFGIAAIVILTYFLYKRKKDRTLLKSVSQRSMDR